MHLRIRAVVGAAVLVALALPGTALAAGKPKARTGAAASITPQTATLTGRVTPNGAPTTYFFQYGPTSLYGASTPPTTAAKRMSVAVPIGGLAPFTRYHYRLVAQNRHGLTKGRDRTFKTKRQPLGVSLVATPNPVPFRKPTTLQGILSGTGNAGRRVVLQANPFPYTRGFADVTNAQVTNAQGEFFFPLLTLPVNTQFRVQMTGRPEVVSPVIVAYSKVRVTAHRRHHRTRRGKVIRFYGAVTPADDGARFAIQRFTKHHPHWQTVTGGTAYHYSATSSHYSKRVRIRHSGHYRVWVEIADGQYASSASFTMRVHR